MAFAFLVVKPKNRPGPPGARKIAIDITAVEFDQFSDHCTGTVKRKIFSLQYRYSDHIMIDSACSHFTACIKGPNIGSF